jgi:hypothetical protein
MIPLPLLLALAAPAQDRLPPAEALPPPGAEEAAVLAPITRMFAALEARDATALLAEVRPEGAGTSVVERPDGTRVIRRTPWPDFAKMIASGGKERLVERITNPAVEIDGDIAMVWAPYTFQIDGKLSHCGTDHFDLIREGGRWRILSITWTQRTSGCPAL